ncbi:CusA/CzcA family heavy metal efflux RND transporter [Pseudoduganella eburnea]|uniref:CusA/CzcA family heavy metal efflux RND transporter n=1 Tax=Massilia eburnea TaxID=1776165 RepID=A0A6L6QK56_9BURK|nr:CusA/CzcA family heavy metal efflux RND transporter [Massilia eburnea]MTW12762.1 CusA/CzcA family heavy metal efflux RND transporter [Massilia eburnea]
MFAKFIDFILAQRLFVLIMTAALVGFGWRAAQQLPVEAFPDVQDVQVQVITQMAGQAAEEVERAVTMPVERELSGVPHQTQLRSVTIAGLSVVTLTFEDGTDDYFARQQVLEKLQNVSLPPGVQPGLAPLSTAVGEIYRYVLDAPPGMPASEVRAIQDWTIRPALRSVSGVADVVTFGGVLREYQLSLDPMALARYGISIDQVRQALAANNANAGAGLLRRGDEALAVRGIGLVTRPEDLGRIVVASKGGKPVHASDLGEVIIGHAPAAGSVAYNGRDDVVEGIVQMSKGANAALVVAAVRDNVEQLNKTLPPGVHLNTIYDRTDLIAHTVHTVLENLVVGATLVVAVLILFLGNWRAALIVAAVIPLSLLVAFILLDARGIPANLISLGAVDFGIIIDSAVVLVEALLVRNSLREPGAPRRSPRKTLRETLLSLGHPILFAKAIIIVAFLPIYTFQRVEGKIFTPVAFTLSFAMLGAIILSFTLVPVLLLWTMHRHPLQEKHAGWLATLQEHYRRLLQRALGARKLVFGLSLAVLVATVALAPMLGSEFLPKLDEGNIWLTMGLPASATLERTQLVEREVRRILRSYPEVTTVVSHVGRPDDGTDPKGPNNIEMLAALAPRGEWRFADKESLISDMSDRIHLIPGVSTNFSQVIEDSVEEALSGVKGEIAVKVFGPDLETIGTKSREIAAILGTVRGASDIEAVPIGGQSELDITLDRESMGRLGVNVADVNGALQTVLGGMAASSYYEGERRFDVTLRLREESRASAEQIGALPIMAPGGASVPLSSLARITVRQGPSRISRETGGRVASVKANVVGRDQASFVAEAQEKVARQLELPPGYSITWGGQFENQQRAVRRLQVIVPAAVLLIFLLLFWAFRSVRQALLVLGIVPFTLVGGVAALAVAGLHFSVSAAVGFIAVAGISVQNGVIMVEQMIENLREGARLNDAAIDGAAGRLRPILMTALMAGLGLLPAALSHGIGSETQRPFALVIVGGIVSATAFTLLLLPLAFPLLREDKEEE